ADAHPPRQPNIPASRSAAGRGPFGGRSPGRYPRGRSAAGRGSLRDRPRRIGHPVRPGADVQRGADAGELEGEELVGGGDPGATVDADLGPLRSEEHTSELQSRENLVCRLLLEKRKIMIV